MYCFRLVADVVFSKDSHHAYFVVHATNRQENHILIREILKYLYRGSNGVLPFRGIDQILKKLGTRSSGPAVRHVVFLGGLVTSRNGNLSLFLRHSWRFLQTREEGKMADKFSEFAGRMGKAPKGVGTGMKLLAAAAALAYGIKESVYTGIIMFLACTLKIPVCRVSSYCSHA